MMEIPAQGGEHKKGKVIINFTHTFFFVVASVVSVFCTGLAYAAPFQIDEPEPWAKNPLGKSSILAVCLPDHATIKSKQANPLYASIDWKGFSERDLVILEMRKASAHIVSKHDKGDRVPRYVTTFSQRNRVGSKSKGLDVIAACENKLEYVLIGKDTGVKMRWDLFPPNNELYALIDAMPMRRFEMRQRKENK